MDPNQQPSPIQPLGPQVQPTLAPAPTAGMYQHDQIQDVMRRKILKIIFGLSTLSILGVAAIFVFGGGSDVSLLETEPFENVAASYTAPVAWTEDTEPGLASYYNAESVEASQASYVVVTPLRATFNTALISAGEIDSILDEYEQYINESETGLSVSDRSEITLDSFSSAYEYDVSGLAENGSTRISGKSRVMFDSLNYVHIIEFVAIKSYFDANTAEIEQLLDTYEANQ